MPRKKSKQLLLNEQKKIITSRLMQISLKIDDYVYKSKPITKYEAEMYMKEVDSYKMCCEKDKRSLQVIEKLIRCMKSIILEHQDEKFDSNRSISPVYSICDEDRTQFTEGEQRAVELQSINDNIVDLYNAEEDNVYHKPIGKTSETSYINDNITIDIHRAISHLSLNDGQDGPEVTSPDIICSQNLLNNFEDITIVQNDFNKNLTKSQSQSIPMSRKTNIDNNNKTTDFLDKPLKVTKPIFNIVKPANFNIKDQIAMQSIDLTQSTDSNIVPISHCELNALGLLSKDQRAKQTIDLTQNINFNFTNLEYINNTRDESNKIYNVAHKLESKDVMGHIYDNVCVKNYNHIVKKQPTQFKLSSNDSTLKSVPLQQTQLINTVADICDTNQHEIPILTLNESSKFIKKYGIESNVSAGSLQTTFNPTLMGISNQTLKSTPLPIRPSYNDCNSNLTLITNSNIPNQIIANNTIQKESPLTNKINNTLKSTLPKSHNKNKITPDMKKDINIKKKRAPNKKKLVGETAINPKIIVKTQTGNESKRLRKNSTVKGKKKQELVPIYNTNIENDLSWMENIRYVREVNAEENMLTPSYLDDTFWENYCLPANWDDSEFLYSI